MTPTEIDQRGTTVPVALDTHSADLSLDLAASASLDVGGHEVDDGELKGERPGGNHREASSASPPKARRREPQACRSQGCRNYGGLFGKR